MAHQIFNLKAGLALGLGLGLGLGLHTQKGQTRTTQGKGNTTEHPIQEKTREDKG
jgi:hypothetical protein